MKIFWLLLLTHNARKPVKIDENKGFLSETRNLLMLHESESHREIPNGGLGADPPKAGTFLNFN